MIAGPEGNEPETASQRLFRDSSQTEIRRGLFRNSGLIAACRFISASASLLSVPVIIGRLGIVGYGVWETMLSAAMITTILQNTVNSTMLWRLSAAYGAQDKAEIRRLVRIGVAVTLVLFVCITPLAWIVRIPLARLLHIASASDRAATGLLPLLVGIVVLGGINETMAAAISGSQRSGVTTLIQTVSLIVNYTVVIVGLLHGAGLSVLLIGLSTAWLINAIALYAYGSRVCGRLSLLPTVPDRNDVRLMSRYAGLTFVGFISAAMRGQTDKLVLAHFASPALVGCYGIAARLASVITEASNFFYVPTLAAAGALNANHDWAGVRRLYSNMMAIVSFAVGGVVVLIASLYDRILVLWLGRVLPDVPQILWLLLAGGGTAVILTGPGTAICKGIGRVGIETAYVLVGLSSNLVLTVVLVWKVGALGTVIASAVSWSASSLFFTYVLHAKLSLPNSGTRRALQTIAAVSITVLAIRWWIPALPAGATRQSAVWSGSCYGIVAGTVYLALLALFAGFRPRSLRVRVTSLLGGQS